MPRRKLIYTDYYPYHVTARANNKEWFYIPKEQVWKIFVKELNLIVLEEKFKIHAFVLMDNHYHMLCSTDDSKDLGVVMQRLQKNVSRKINKKADRINHVFGGPYKGSLITTPTYYKTVLKYVFRNPVEAGIVSKVEDYKYSSLNSDEITTVFPYSIDSLINYRAQKLIPWLNGGLERSPKEIYKGLLKTEFKPVLERSYR